MWRRVTMEEDAAANRMHAKLTRLTFWYGWIWGASFGGFFGLIVACLAYARVGE